MYKEKKERIKKPLSTDHKKKTVYGLLRVQRALETSLKPHTIKESFEKCGIYPFSAVKMLNQFDLNISKDQEEQLLSSVPELANRMALQGELFDKDFSDFNIGVDEDNKDRNIVSRRRSVILNNINHIQSEIQKGIDKEQAVIIAAQAKLQKEINRTTKAPKENKKKRKCSEETVATPSEDIIDV